MHRTLLKIVVLAAGLFWTTARLFPQADFGAVTDRTSYNVGSEVLMEFVQSAKGSGPESSANRTPEEIVATIRYAGEDKPVAESVPLPGSLLPSGHQYSSGYRTLWKVPWDARSGRYEVELEARDPAMHRVLWKQPRAASFAVYRKLAQIEEIKLDKTFYNSADLVGVAVKVRNLTPQPLSDLRVEFSKRYWPWIAQSAERAGIDVVSLADSFSLPAGGESVIQSARAAVTDSVKQPSLHQYAVVVWDRERKEIYDIAFSPLVIIQPPGVHFPKPYPLQYLYPELGSVNVSSYRHFYPPDLGSPAIEFDRSHTMFAAGSEATVVFKVGNPTSKPWHNTVVRARLLDPSSRESYTKVIEAKLDLEAQSPGLKKQVSFTLPTDGNGIYRLEVQVTDASGQALADNSLELGVNPLPKSILIFCAHEDDEGAHAGTIRAAVENHIPIHLVYLTSGDAGSCDRYYEHSCRPAEALNFGALRMEEARAALGHLGVAREDIYFLGLPDGGSGQIWYDHVSPQHPYLSVLLASDHAPYENLARPNLPYARDSVVEMLKEFIQRFQPEAIYTGHPDERHVDHRTDNWFVVKALQQLRPGPVSPDLKLLVDQVYGPGPQAHAPYRYQKHTLHVSGEAMALAQEARWFYQSQDGNRAQGHLRTFDQLPRAEVHWQVLDWKDHEGWNEQIEPMRR